MRVFLGSSEFQVCMWQHGEGLQLPDSSLPFSCYPLLCPHFKDLMQTLAYASTLKSQLQTDRKCAHQQGSLCSRRWAWVRGPHRPECGLGVVGGQFWGLDCLKEKSGCR